MKVFVYSLTLLVMAKMVTSLNDALVATEVPFRHLDCPPLDDALHPVQLPHPDNCSKYYSCQKGIAHPMNCPEQLHWSMLTYRCDYPVVAKCSSATLQPNPTIELPTTPAYAISEPPSPENAAFYQNYAGDCNRFYQCQVMRCPQHLHWNAQLQRCDFPHMAVCERAPITMQPPLPLTTSTTTAPSTYSPSVPPMITTVADAEFIPTAATPPPTTAAAPTTAVSGSSTAEDQHDLNQLCSANPQNNRYLHYPGDCHKFILCNGIAFVYTCPSNLFWNAELLTCDRYCK